MDLYLDKYVSLEIYTYKCIIIQIYMTFIIVWVVTKLLVHHLGEMGRMLKAES
jgi:hypothetical protein